MSSAEIVREVDGIAAEPGTLGERAEALLVQLQRVVRFDAGWIALLPPDQEEHVSLARAGYDERISGYLDSASMLGDVELVGMHRSRRPIRGRDMPFPPAEVPGWAEYLLPGGFRDGLTAGLFTPEGHYLGLLALHTQAADQVSDVARDLIGLLASRIAFAVDPLRSMATVARIVHGAAAGSLLAPSGALLPLPGLPGHQLLAPGSGVLVAAALQLAEGSPYAAFLAPLQGAEGADGADGVETHVRITVLAAPRELEPFAAAVVLISPPGDLHGLSHRELQVLGLLVTGASDEWIAVVMGIATDTVALHLDHVRAKLVASSRTAVAARALRLGMFVPSSFFVRG